MKRISILVVTIASLLASNGMASAEELALQMVGVWRVKSFEGVDVQSKEAYKPFANNPPSYYVFTQGGRYIKGNSSGTYKVEGAKVTITYDRSTTDGLPEFTLEREVEVSGKVMTLKSMPVVNKMAGKTIVFTVIAEKIE
jgi:hypothetical protein